MTENPRPSPHRRHTRLAAFLGVAAALAGCGGSHKALQHVSSHIVPVAVSHAPQLVSMRRTDGATWQTVVIRTDGTGDVGIFIGERAGTHHEQFRLSPGELARLKRLVVDAARTGQTPSFNAETASVTYVIFAHQRVLETAQGHVPRRLTGLVRILNGLIGDYA